MQEPLQPARPEVTEQLVLEVLGDIADGKQVITLQNEPGELEGGFPIFRTKSGWMFKIWSELGVWHHLQDIWSPDGTHINIWDDRWMSEFRALRNYDPPKKIVYTVYKLKPSLSFTQEEIDAGYAGNIGNAG